MADSDLARETNSSNNKTNIHLDDPFQSPTSTSSNPPTLSQPCVYPTISRPSPPAGMTSLLTNTRHEMHDRRKSVPSKAGSLSSAGDSATMTPLSSMDLEYKYWEKEREPKSPSRHSRGSKQSIQSRDPEKVPYKGNIHLSPPNSSGRFTDVPYADEEEVDNGSRLQEENAVKILLFLSLPCVFLSSLNTVWEFIAIVITILTQPIRLCAKRPTFGQQLSGLLGPTLNLQLRCIYTPLSPHANEDGSYHTGMLVLGHLLSPFISFAVMFAAWVLAVYWVSSAMVGDPAGQDKRDDGKETVLSLRNWWEKWLLKGVKKD